MSNLLQERIFPALKNFRKRSVIPKVYQVWANISYKGFPHFLPDSQVFTNNQKAMMRKTTFLEEIKRHYSGIESIEIEVREIDFIID